MNGPEKPEKAVDYDEFDPGICEVVKYVHSLGYRTTDSGDGSTKLGTQEGVQEFPHVIVDLNDLLVLDIRAVDLMWHVAKLEGRIRKKFGESWCAEMSWSVGTKPFVVLSDMTGAYQAAISIPPAHEELAALRKATTIALVTYEDAMENGRLEREPEVVAGEMAKILTLHHAKVEERREEEKRQ